MLHLKDDLDASLGSPVGSSGDEYRYHCPECIRSKNKKDLKGKLHVNYQKGAFNCFSCGYRGSLKHLASRFGISVSQPAASWNSMTLRGLLHSGNGSSWEKQREEALAYDPTLELEYPCDVRVINQTDPHYAYLSHRGVGMDQINYYKLSVSKDPDSYWADRIFIPCYHEDDVVYWTARSINPDAKLKYMTPYGVDKRYYMFNMNNAKQFDSLVITEGAFDAIAVGSNAVALFGKAASEHHRKVLLESDFTHYTVCLDPDAGKEAYELASWLDSRGKNVYIVTFPEGLDPASDPEVLDRIRNATPFSFSDVARSRLSLKESN